MSRTSIIVIVILIVAALGGYFYLQDPVEDARSSAANVTEDIAEATRTAMDFCTSKGGTVETITAAEGVVRLCVTADGTKTEVGQFMAANQ